MTARDMIKSSMRLLGILASEQAPSASEAADGLSALNLMLDSWSNEGLLSNSITREEFPLVASQAAYTMGVGANFNTARPMEVTNILVQLAGSPETEIPVKLLTKDQFVEISQKELTSTIPQYAYVEGTAPNETINFWPVPSGIITAVIYSRKPLSQVATLDTVLSYAPGYERAIKYNLAVEFAPEFGREASNAVVIIASESKGWIKRTNTKPAYLTVDSALRAPGSYNIFTGGTT